VADMAAYLQAVRAQPSVQLIDVDVQRLPIFRSAAWIVPHESAQRFGADARSSAHCIEDLLLDPRQREIVVRDRLPAARTTRGAVIRPHEHGSLR
jgi:hypothetical protein